MINTISHQVNSNQNHNKMQLHSHQDGALGRKMSSQKKGMSNPWSLEMPLYVAKDVINWRTLRGKVDPVDRINAVQTVKCSHVYSCKKETGSFYCCCCCRLFACLLWPCPMACGILVPQPRIKFAPPPMEVQSLDYWTAREVLRGGVLRERHTHRRMCKDRSKDGMSPLFFFSKI